MFLKSLQFLAVGCAFLSAGHAFAQDAIIDQAGVVELYKGLVESKISGGEYLVSYHNKHYTDDMDLIIIFSGENQKRKFSKTFMDHNKTTFMQAIEKNASELHHKDGSYEVVDVSVDETGRKAHVNVKLVSNFEVFAQNQQEMRYGHETMDCKDTLIMGDDDVTRIKSSQCDVYVIMK